MIGDTAQLAVELKLKDQQFQSNITRDEASLRKLNTTVGKTGTAFSAVAGHIGGFQRNMGRAVSNLGKGVSTAAANLERLAIAGGALAIGGGIAAVKWAGDFEAQLRTINTIARETPEGLNKIGDAIREVARRTGTPLEELTQGYYDLLSAGIKAADASNVLNQANKLAIGGLASTAETVDLLTTAINVYGGDASKAAQYADEFAKSIERGKVTAAELAASYAQVAPLARSLGIENKELAAGYARLTAAGTPAGEASTQMASALTALLKKTPDLEKLQKQTGKNYSAIAGSQGLNVALEQMRNDADKAGIELVKLVGRKEALLYILQTTGPNLKAYNADLAAMADAEGTAAAQMAERQQGLNFQLARFKALVKDAGITIGSALIPKLIPLIEKFNDFINNNQEGIKRFGADLASAFENVAKWIAKLDFKQIGDSLKTAAFFGRGLIQAFLAAPQWLQTAVVTGWGLNKLTGGAVQNIMADLTKAVIGGAMQQFIARGATPANPLFVADVSGGLGKGILGAGAAAAGIGTGTAVAAIAAAAVVTILSTQDLLSKTSREERLREGGLRAQQYRGSAAAFVSPVHVIDMSPEARQQRSDLHKVALTALAEQRRGERGLTAGTMADAVALGTERGIVHSGVFKKAQTVREAGGFATSREALISMLHEKKPLGVDALVTGQAIALAVGNHLRNDRNPDLKSAVYNLGLLRRLQAQMPRDLAARLEPKIHSLEVAIDRTTAAVNAIKINAFTGFNVGDAGSRWKPTSQPTPLARRTPTVNPYTGFTTHAAGFLGLTTGPSEIGVAGEAGTEAVAIIKNPRRITAQSTKVYVTNWPGGFGSGASATDAVSSVKKTMSHAERIAAALKAIKARAISAGHLGREGEVRDTLRDDRERGMSWDKIINAKPITVNANVAVSTRDVNTAQSIKRRYGPTPTQAGAA